MLTPNNLRTSSGMNEASDSMQLISFLPLIERARQEKNTDQSMR